MPVTSRRYTAFRGGRKRYPAGRTTCATGSSGGAVPVLLHSYATPFEGKMEVTDYSGLFFSRDEFWDVADELDKGAHQQVTGPISYIVGDFLASLEHRAEKLTTSEANAVNEAFGHLLRAMVRQTPASLQAAKAPIAATLSTGCCARKKPEEDLKSPCPWCQCPSITGAADCMIQRRLRN